MSHLATPRQSAITVAGSTCSWTLRSAGGSRPSLIVWGRAPAEAVLERLARAGLAVLTHSPQAELSDLLLLVDTLLGRPVGVAAAETPGAELTNAMDVKQIPLLAVTDWDAVPRWAVEHLS